MIDSIEAHTCLQTAQARPGTCIAAWVAFSNPHFLAGPYFGRYGLASITDHRQHPFSTSLLSDLEMRLEIHAATSTEVYTLAPALEGAVRKAAALDPAIGSPHLYLSIGVHMPSQTYMTGNLGPADRRIFCEDRFPESPTRSHPYISRHICSKSDYTTDELMSGLIDCIDTGMDLAKLRTLLTESRDRIEQKQRALVLESVSTQPTLDRPFRLRIEGNDDASWSKTYPTLEAAQADLETIAAEGRPEAVFRLLHSTN